MPRTVVPGIVGEPDVRIRVADGVTTVSISSPVKAVWVAPVVDQRRPEAAKAPARIFAPVDVKLTAAGWQLTDPSGLRATYPRNVSLQFSAEEGTIGAPTGEKRVSGTLAAGASPAIPATAPLLSGGGVSINGRRFSGIIQLTQRSDVGPAAFDAIETLNLEDYVRGVVTAEMYANWPVEAYRAQAVAARSYALHERMRRRAAGASFDLEAGVRDQAYSGVGSNPLASKAVDDTHGVVLTWSGTVLRSYYHSTCGGRAASARDTWPSDSLNAFNLAGPLQSQPHDIACQSAPQYRWTIARTRADLAARLRGFGREKRLPIASITGVESVRGSSLNAAGRPTSYLILQPGGQSYTLSAEDFRSAANAAYSGSPAPSANLRLPSGDFEAARSGNGITFTGRGFGHGVGLCQFCAKGFAEKGEKWPEILERFYPGARIERAF